MIKRPLLVTLALALTASSALAAPMLRGDIVVTDAIVTVGDMFEDAGALAELPLFRAPLPGTTGNVDLTAVRQATARVGLNEFGLNGFTSVRVSRASVQVDRDLLASLVAQDLRARGILSEGMDAQVSLSTVIDTISAAPVQVPAHLLSLRYLPGNGTFSASFSISGVERKLEVNGTIAVTVDAPHLVASLSAGTILRPDHIVMRPVPVWQADAQGIPSMEQLVGMSLNRQSRDGMLLRASDVGVPLAVAKNELVTIYLRQGPMTLTVKGQAVTGAAEGSPLQVLNLVSRRVINAVAVAPGVVEISAAPVTTAGL
jgi:flagella basal body P-ring formation protein FlgA